MFLFSWFYCKRRNPRRSPLGFRFVFLCCTIDFCYEFCFPLTFISCMDGRRAGPSHTYHSRSPFRYTAHTHTHTYTWLSFQEGESARLCSRLPPWAQQIPREYHNFHDLVPLCPCVSECYAAALQPFHNLPYTPARKGNIGWAPPFLTPQRSVLSVSPMLPCTPHGLPLTRRVHYGMHGVLGICADVRIRNWKRIEM